MQVLLCVGVVQLLESLFEYRLDDMIRCPFLRRRDKLPPVGVREKGSQER